ncbi:MAG: hypothetical protein JXA14_24890 [Anaerolineae bacterium]|nr:hypothetical protein [Anaerolineae bacterium]
MKTFEQALTETERRTLVRLATPGEIQAFLDGIPYSADPIYRCPLRVLREHVAHCFDGAMFAAAMLRRIGYPPLVMEMTSNGRDDVHLLALYKREGHWGAVAKSNFVGLRFREPVYRTLRELVMSYFELYYNLEREKTLRGYTIPLNLKTYDKLDWMTRDEPLDLIADRIDESRRFPLLTQSMIDGLRLADDRTYQAGLMGANETGLFRPDHES